MIIVDKQQQQQQQLLSYRNVEENREELCVHAPIEQQRQLEQSAFFSIHNTFC
jgi:hypothetical protein